jgi:hypothetical protein
MSGCSLCKGSEVKEIITKYYEKRNEKINNRYTLIIYCSCKKINTGTITSSER